MKRIIAAAVLFGLCSGLSACGNKGGGAVEGGAGKAEPAPVVTTTKSSAGEAGISATVSRELCDFLQDETSRLEERGSTVAALAGFAIDYTGWIGEDVDRALAAVAELDSITTSACPKAREQILKVLDSDSLAEALGR
jgi:hypothetical protein